MGRCDTEAELSGLVADHVYRFEGMSNPDDEAIVVGVTLPGLRRQGRAGLGLRPLGRSGGRWPACG